MSSQITHVIKVFLNDSNIHPLGVVARTKFVCKIKWFSTSDNYKVVRISKFIK